MDRFLDFRRDVCRRRCRALRAAFTCQPLSRIAYNVALDIFRSYSSPTTLEVASPAWHDMPRRAVPDESTNAIGSLESPASYSTWLRDGLALLASVRPAPSTVFFLIWANPFPFATQIVPFLGDEIAWHLGRTVDPTHHPDVERIITRANVVLVPMRSIQSDSHAFKRALSAPARLASFTVGAESAHWRLWFRHRPTPVS